MKSFGGIFNLLMGCRLDGLFSKHFDLNLEKIFREGIKYMLQYTFVWLPKKCSGF